jgi:hypothetical protein
MNSAAETKLNKFNEIFSESAGRLRTVPGAPNPFYVASKKRREEAPEDLSRTKNDEKHAEVAGS